MKRYGLRLDPIVIGEDYILGGYGSLGGDILQPNGQWTDYLPENEEQARDGFDPQFCASEGTENALAMLAKRVFGQSRNWSARFVAKESGTTEQGNSPQKTAETIRKKGMPNEVDWPYSKDIRTWEEFYKDIPQAVYSLAVAFISEFAFKHEYVVTQPQYLKQALTKSPVGISVTAWFKGDDGLYHAPQGVPNNHWVVLVGYEEGKHWLVYDSYGDNGEYVKKLRWDFPFAIAKRYQLSRQIASEQSWAKWLIELVMAAFGVKSEPQPEPAVPVTPPPAPEPEKPSDSRLIAALIKVESGGDDYAIGDKTLTHKAYGCLQIRQPYMDDVNRVWGTNHKAQDCLGNRELSVRVARAYFKLYKCTTDEQKARVHNGGPSAKTPGTKQYNNTTGYWQKVRKLI